LFFLTGESQSSNTIRVQYCTTKQNVLEFRENLKKRKKRKQQIKKNKTKNQTNKQTNKQTKNKKLINKKNK
jgi:hypothetical protein